ncbi:MAG: helix-turn-helix transcriptional regulator [Nitrospirae bacterium]|nr:helix-turn-helix transcriptional regulator [Nitrospirota bacterium]
MKANQFAEVIGISQGSLSEIENQKTNPSAETLSLIVRNTNINSFWLLTGEGSMYKDDKAPRRIYGYRREIPEGEIDMVKMQRFIGSYWEKADEEERTWLKIQFRKAFPEYIEWLETHKYDVPDEQCVMEQQKRYGSSTELPSDFSVNETQKPYSVKKEKE